MPDYRQAARDAAMRYGVDPDIFDRMIGQESGYAEDVINGTRRSSAGALGIAQFMPATAAGLGINPLDPMQALDAAAKYLKASLDQFGGRYDLALAAYNAGAGAVQQYGGVPPFAETQNYVNSILGTNGRANTSGGIEATGNGRNLMPGQGGGGQNTTLDPEQIIRNIKLANPTVQVDENSFAAWITNNPWAAQLSPQQQVRAMLTDTFDSSTAADAILGSLPNPDNAASIANSNYQWNNMSAYQQAMVNIQTAQNQFDNAIKLGDRAAAAAAQEALNYWKGIAAGQQNDANVLTGRGQDINSADSQYNTQAQIYDANQRYQVGMAQATTDAQRLKVEAQRNAELAVIAQMQDFRTGQSNQTNQFGAETTRASEMGRLQLDTNKFLGDYASGARGSDLFSLYFLERGMTPDFNAMAAGQDLGSGPGIKPGDPMKAYTPTTAPPDFTKANPYTDKVGQASAAGVAASQQPNQFLGPSTATAPTAPAAAPAFTPSAPVPTPAFTPSAPVPTSTQAVAVTAAGGSPAQSKGQSDGKGHYWDEARQAWANDNDNSLYDPRQSQPSGAEGVVPSQIPGSGQYAPKPAKTAAALRAAAEGNSDGKGHYWDSSRQGWANDNDDSLYGVTQERMAQGGFTTARQFISGDSPLPNPSAGGARPEIIENPTGAPLRVHPNPQSVNDMRQRYAAYGAQPRVQQPINVAQGQPAQPGGANASRFAEIIQRLMRNWQPDNGQNGYAAPGSGQIGGWNAFAQGGGGEQIQGQAVDFKPYYSETATQQQQPMIQRTPESWMQQRDGAMAKQQQFKFMEATDQAEEDFRRDPLMAPRAPTNESAMDVRRFALGTGVDNSQAFQDAGIGSAWIPSSNNSAFAGTQLPPRLAALAKYGFPLTPGMVYGSTGQVMPETNIGNAFDARGMGVAPSMQTLNRMSPGELEAQKGLVEGVGKLSWRDVINGLSAPTQNLQTAQRARAA